MIPISLLQHPEWTKVEATVEQYLTQITDITTIDLTQPAEHVKAELIGRIKAHQTLNQFLADSKIVQNPITRSTTFK